MVGIAFWASRSQSAVEAGEIAETRQPALASTVPEANPAVKTTGVPAKTDSAPSTQTKTNTPKKVVAIASTQRVPLPPSAPILAAGEKDPLTKPAGRGLQAAIASLKPLLETASPFNSPISPIPIASKESDQEIPAQAENIKPFVLRLANPIANGGDVYYAINKVSFSLSPGEYHSLPQTSACLVEFHRGGDFGNAKLQLQAGDYVFDVGETGWILTPGTIEPEAILRQAH
jgi:hypothetical protein